jgi:homoserine dehydrogenase
VQLTGLAARRVGWLYLPSGFATSKLLARDFSEAKKAGDVREWLQQAKADVLFEASSLNAESGQPAIDYLRAALEAGAHAISANKGPLVYAWRELTELAASRGRCFFFESATMDGVPIYSLFRETLPAIKVDGFRGVLNSTTTVILDAMGGGFSLEEAIGEAQRLGVAETDPSADIDGIDAAVKVVALANVLMGANLVPANVDRRGIGEISRADLREAQASGEAWRLVSRARRLSDGNITACVAPERLKATDPLASVRGTSLMIAFETDIFPELIIGERDPGPQATAYGLLADFLNAVRTQ